jgi:D-amino-acid dehydrogenase
VKDLAAHVEKQGGSLIKAEVTDVIHENGHATGVLTKDGQTLSGDAVVVALGAWSGPLTKKLGIDVPMESERGYHVELYEPSFTPTTPTMITTGKFLMTPMEGRLRLAGVVEFGGLDAPPSRGPFDLLRRNIQEALPGLTWKEEKEWMGHRPAPADSIPIIGETPEVKSAYLGFGHHHVGMTGGPKTGRLLAQVIQGRTPNVDMTPYSPARFK